jgi:hypothetical protein
MTGMVFKILRMSETSATFEWPGSRAVDSLHSDKCSSFDTSLTSFEKYDLVPTSYVM